MRGVHVGVLSVLAHGTEVSKERICVSTFALSAEDEIAGRVARGSAQSIEPYSGAGRNLIQVYEKDLQPLGSPRLFNWTITSPSCSPRIPS